MGKKVTSLKRLSKVTKKEIVDFANQHFGNNYAVIYKQQGIDPNEKKIAKPVFLDFKKDIQQFKIKRHIPVLYKRNLDNDLFSLSYVFGMGNNADNKIGLAFRYLDYLGTSRLSSEQIQREFNRLVCSFQLSADNERTFVSLSGLKENMPEAIGLLEQLLTDVQINKMAYDNLVADIIKERANNKLN